MPSAIRFLSPVFSPLRLAILGPGLIGGSLALAARHRGLCSHLAIWCHSAVEQQAVDASGVADLVTDDFKEIVARAKLVIFCTPPGTMLPLAAQIRPHLLPTAVVTDAGSVKGELAREMHEIFRLSPAGSRYVGAHPMAGGEGSGLSAAKVDLFEGRTCLLTPIVGETAPDALKTVRRFWQALEMPLREMSPEAHDEAVALVSHLPHLLAAVLARYVGGQPDDPQACAGPGWRDMTRLAGGSPDLWTEILSRNRVPLTNALRGMITDLRAVLEILEEGRDTDLKKFLGEAKRRRGERLS